MDSRGLEGGKTRKKKKMMMMKKKKTRGPDILPSGEYPEELVDIVIAYQPNQPASLAFNPAKQQREQHIASLAGDKREFQILVEYEANSCRISSTHSRSSGS